MLGCVPLPSINLPCNPIDYCSWASGVGGGGRKIGRERDGKCILGWELESVSAKQAVGQRYVNFLCMSAVFAPGSCACFWVTNVAVWYGVFPRCKWAWIIQQGSSPQVAARVKGGSSNLILFSSGAADGRAAQCPLPGCCLFNTGAPAAREHVFPLVHARHKLFRPFGWGHPCSLLPHVLPPVLGSVS